MTAQLTALRECMTTINSVLMMNQYYEFIPSENSGVAARALAQGLIPDNTGVICPKEMGGTLRPHTVDGTLRRLCRKPHRIRAGGTEKRIKTTGARIAPDACFSVSKEEKRIVVHLFFSVAFCQEVCYTDFEYDQIGTLYRFSTKNRGGRHADFRH